MKKILLGFITFILLSVWVSAYEVTNKDYDYIDRINERIFVLVDDKQVVSAEKIVTLLSKYVETKAKSERLKEILLVVIDDVEYEYYLWNYSEGDYVETDEDFWEEFTDENFKAWYSSHSHWNNHSDDESEENHSDDYEDEYSDEDYDDWENETDDNYSDNEANYSDDEDEYWEEDYNDNEQTSWNNESAEQDSWEENIEASYKVNGDEITLVSWKLDQKHADVFAMFANLIPKSQRKDFKLYNVDNSPNGDTFAHVIQDEEEISKWNITVNIAMFYPDGKLDTKESVYTLIHEYSHVLTLGKAQMDYSNFDACTQRLLQEWCLNASAYLNTFINTFWAEDFANSQKDQANDFYTWKESNFTTDYASTNPWEDIAETFTAFVLNNKPTWDTIADKKKLFFYNYPEMVKLRSIIRSKLPTSK